MIRKGYYEKLGGFSSLLSELREKLGREQTEIPFSALFSLKSSIS